MVVCASACECMHTGVLVSACTEVCLPMWVPEVSIRYLHLSLSVLVFETVFHWTWSSLAVWAQWQVSSRDPSFWSFPSTGPTNSCCHSQLLSGAGDLNFGPHICKRSTLLTETRFLHRNLKTILWVGFLQGIAVQWWLVFHQQRLVCVLSHLISPMCTKSPIIQIVSYTWGMGVYRTI